MEKIILQVDLYNNTKRNLPSYNRTIVKNKSMLKDVYFDMAGYCNKKHSVFRCTIQ